MLPMVIQWFTIIVLGEYIFICTDLAQSPKYRLPQVHCENTVLRQELRKYTGVCAMPDILSHDRGQGSPPSPS